MAEEEEDLSVFHGALLTALEKNEVEFFSQLLNEYIDWDDADSILGHGSDTRVFVLSILETIQSFNYPHFVEAFFEVLKQINPPPIRNEPYLSTKTQIFMLPEAEEGMLAWLHSVLPDPGLADMILELNGYDGDEELSLMLDRMTDLAPEYEKTAKQMDTILWVILKDVDQHPWDLQSNNRAMLNWLVPKAAPARSISKPDRADRFHLERLPDLHSALQTVLTHSSSIKIYQELLQVVIDDRNLWAIAGPFHPLAGQDITYIPENIDEMLDYLCPMFLNYGPISDNPLDNNYLLDEDDPSRNQEWFSGYCWECFNGIPERTWATRRPDESGGWFGCYCSWQCADWAAQGIQCQPDTYLMEKEMLLAAQRMIESIPH